MGDHFHHEALMYAGEDGFLAGTAPFLREGLEREDAMLVVVAQRKIDALRSELGSDAGGVRFADMAEVGANPARIIPAWREFADQNAGRALRGIGEPIFPEHSADELIECQRHESLLNLAFADTPGFRLMCPYDVDAMGPDVIDEAERSHPHVVEDGAERSSTCYRGDDAIAGPFDVPLPKPRGEPEEVEFDVESLGPARDLVAFRAAEAGIGRTKAEDLVLAVNELLTNTLRHAGGTGHLAVWRENGSLLCEVRDAGRIDDPLAGRKLAPPGQVGGHGLWIATQLCDLVQVRTYESGNVVRIHTHRG
jgi:anti-sigma regulatory factor (Ser/Thr protein kinase)